ncbi:MAG: phage tail protein [Bacteroidota bacterium]
MAGEKQEAPWPVPKFHFKVIFGNIGEASFQEVSGLDSDADVIEYRAGNSTTFSPVRMPELAKVTDVTLKKGLVKNDGALLSWLSEIRINTIKRETVTIQLLDEEHNPLFTWTLKNAWPMKVTGTDRDTHHNEVVIEEMILAHEGLLMKVA